MHDRLQAELEVEYSVEDVLGEEVTWETDAWFYLPPEVGIGAMQTRPEVIYEDMRVFSRLKTPPLDLSDLARIDGEGSPLAALAVLANSRPGGTSWNRDVRREARLVAWILRSAAHRQLLSATACGDPIRATRLLEALCGSGEAVGPHFRALCDQLLSQRIKDPTVKSLAACDEYLSLQIELLAARSLVVMDELKLTDEALRARLVALARREAQWRCDHQMRSQLPPEEDLAAEEAFLDQAGLLKRYVGRVLQLRSRPSAAHALAQNAVLGVAAAAAMSWAVGLQLFTFFALGLDLSQGAGSQLVMAFAATAVAGYILKDRLKAWVAEVLARQLPRYLDDRRLELSWGESDEPLALVAERVLFQPFGALEPEVHRQHREAVAPVQAMVTQDDVLHYHRRVRVHPRRALSRFPRFAGLHEDIRINIGRWVRTLAAPHRLVAMLGPDGKPAARRLANRYVVPVVTRQRRLVDGKVLEEHWSVHRMLLTQRGITRVETLTPSLTEGNPVPGAFV